MADDEPAAPDQPPSSVLVVVAHPDDVDFGMAGTLATWSAQGVPITYCIVTDGDAGGFDAELSPRMAEIRRDEQRRAADIVGVKEVRFLGHPDGRVEANLALRRDLARVIREVRPERVLTQSPIRNLERIAASHPDHLAVGEATLCAVYPDARNPFAHPELAAEGLEPHTVAEVWLAGTTEPDTFVDVTDTFETKLEALRSHHSQVGHLEHDRFVANLREWATRSARQGGLAEGRLAEAFRRCLTA